MKTIVVIKKRSDFIELEEIIKFYNTNHLCLCIFSNNKIEKFSRIALEDLTKKFKNKVKKIDSFFFNKNIKNGYDIYEELVKLLTKKNVVVLPLANGFHFINAAGIFKKNKNVTVCHISDGILDSISRYKFYLIKNKLTLINIFKSFVFITKLFYNQTDYSFSIWASYSPFSKKTINIKPNFNYHLETKSRLEGILTKSQIPKKLILLIPSHIVDKDLLIKHYKLEKDINKVIVSTYTGEVFFKNKKYYLNGPVTAEELLQTNCFHKVFAGPSTAAFYAKKINPDIEVSILSNYKQRKHWGKLQDIWIGKKAIKNDINYEYLSKE
ncbi:hypothetical protein IDH08_04430 [Pelagibacterales bacterium SAG-MED22]|nr:hypothetical protein [Pelagibacterales bacterium SAG-MED22]